MTYESLLVIYIEVSIAIVGFSGLIAALKSDSRDQWNLADRAAFRFLFAGGGLTAFFSALPLILVGAGIDVHTTWQVASYLLVCVVTIRGLTILWELRSNLEPRMASMFVVIFPAVFGAGLGGFYELGWPYVVFLTIFIGVGLVNFSTLVMRLVREKEGDV